MVSSTFGASRTSSEEMNRFCIRIRRCRECSSRNFRCKACNLLRYLCTLWILVPTWSQSALPTYFWDDMYAGDKFLGRTCHTQALCESVRTGKFMMDVPSDFSSTLGTGR